MGIRARVPDDAASGCSCYTPPTPPHGTHRRDAAGAHANEIGALAGQDFAAIVKTDGFGRSLGNGSHRGRKIDPRIALRQQEPCHQQARRHVVGRQDIEDAHFRKL